MMRTWLANLAFLSCFVVAVCRAESPDQPSIFGRLERDLARDAHDGAISRYNIIEAALISSGVNDRTELSRLTRVATNAEAQILSPRVVVTDRVSTPSEESSRQLARQLLEGMHETLLSGKYQADCSSLHTTLTAGDYNCVTATVLFQWMAKRQGLPVKILGTRSHVFSEVGKQKLRVETTCATWLQADGERKPVKETRYLSDLQLLGKIYYNRGVALLQQKKFARAIAMLRRSLAFDTDDASARENVLAAINNWSLEECAAKNFSQAVALLEAGRDISSDYAPFNANDLHVHQKWVLQLCDKGDHKRALELLESGYERRPKARLFNEGRLAVCRSWFLYTMREGKSEAAHQLWSDLTRRFRRHRSFAKYERSTFLSCVTELKDRGQIQEAQRWAKRALRQYPDDPQIRDALTRLTTERS